MLDLRYAFRTLRASPGFTATAIAALAIGIGANTAIFSIVNTVLLRPLPYYDADRVIMFTNTSPRGEGPGASPTKFNVWRAQTDTFTDVSAYRTGVENLTGVDSPEQVQQMEASADVFRLFGLVMARGRSFSPAEDSPNGPHVAVLSDAFWRRRFAADPGILGKSIALGSVSYQVIGVTAPGYRTEEDPPVEVYVPFQIDPNTVDQANYFQVAGRLKPGVTIGAAKAKMKLVADEFRRKFPDSLRGDQGFGVQSMKDTLIGDVKSSLLVLLGAVGFVLLIACANVANLLLVRATGRRREIAIRAAMGAGRGRIIRQLLTESVVLSLAGGIFGLILGSIAVRVLLAANPGNVPRIGTDAAYVSLDWNVLAFTLGLSLLTGVLFGLIPALQASRSDLSSTLKESSGRSGTGLRQNKARSLLVVSEMMLAVVLLIGAGLLIRSFIGLRSVKPGFDSHNVLTMRMSLTGPRFEKTLGVAQLTTYARQRIGALPGVEAVGATCCIPLEGGYGLPFIIVGRPLEGTSTGGGGWITISTGFFETFKIPLVRGRFFSEHDTASSAPVVIINQAMARQYWAKGDPLSDRLIIGKGVSAAFDEPPRQIVGVVADIHGDGLNLDPRPVMYVPQAQLNDAVNLLNSRLTPLAWAVRTKGEPHSLRAPIENALRLASGGLPVATVRSMDEIVARSTARQDFNTLLLSIFAGSALVLAAIGIYGLMAYSVQQRTQEIGIRLALGAGISQVRNMVIFQGMRLALAGVVVGIGAAFALSRVIESFLFGVKARDAAVFVSVPLILSIVALLAVWLPARRATRINPVNALRHE
ncbi:MAG TPA: ABC transporter permease [Bryobacteraceae bacterium]|nr:ABC transporter permease [Bryobacteraceae bacterium]